MHIVFNRYINLCPALQDSFQNLLVNNSGARFMPQTFVNKLHQSLKGFLYQSLKGFLYQSLKGFLYQSLKGFLYQSLKGFLYQMFERIFVSNV